MLGSLRKTCASKLAARHISLRDLMRTGRWPYTRTVGQPLAEPPRLPPAIPL
jgi:hypothetical protein